MPCENLSLEVARMVTPRALLGYVQGLGWQRVENGKRSNIAVFHRPDSRLYQVIIPTDPNLDDFAEAVVEAVRKLAEFEQLPAPAVLDHLLLPPADILRFREVSPDAEAGNLPLEHAVRLLNGTPSYCWPWRTVFSFPSLITHGCRAVKQKALYRGADSARQNEAVSF